MSIDNRDQISSSSSFTCSKKPPDLSSVPVRNAFSLVKRPSERISANFKPFRLKDFTQEIYEALNEPLGEIVETESADTESDDNLKEPQLENLKEEDNENHSNSKILNPKREEYQLKCENHMDLGVSWLETPVKTNPQVKRSTNKTPKTNNNLHVAALSQSNKKCFITPARVTNSFNKNKFVTPASTAKPHVNDKCGSTNRPHPINSIIETPRDKFLTKYSEVTPRNQVRSASTASHEKCNKISIKNTTSVVKKNKENEETKSKKDELEFSIFTNHSSNQFEKITVKHVSYVILNELGRGGSSVVYHCYDFNSKCERAIKKVNLANENALSCISEVKLLDRLQHCSRIIKMFDYELIESEKILYVVLEKGGSDLAKILRDLSCNSEHLPMYMLIYYWNEMLYAVKQIHENDIVHSDLKPANFLRVENGLKLIDFGIASHIQSDMTSVIKNTAVGSINYISPEALTNQSSSNCDSPGFGKPKYKVSYKSDVWSLGCILYQLVYRKPPFHHITHMWAKFSAIVDREYEIDYPELDWVPTKVVDTIKSCLQHNMKARPSVDDLIEQYKNSYSM